MINLKKLIDPIMDIERSRQERLFRLFALMGLSGLIVGIGVGILIGESWGNTIFTIIGFLVLLGITKYAVHYNKMQAGSIAVAFIIIYVILPLNFITTGGIYGGGPIWFFFGVIYVSLVVENRMKYFFLLSSFFLCVGCYYLAYVHPELITPRTMALAHMDSFFSLVITAVFGCVTILFQNFIYRSENEVVKKQKKKIEELSRAQNRFFSNMSHEIRTPINTIIGLNEMILRETESDEVAEDARNIQSASKMLLTLINDILDMSKIESGKMDIVPASYDVGAMCSDIVNMIWIRASEKGLKFHIDVDQSMPAWLFGDEMRIKQILINVLNNAVKYTSEGSVTLAIQCRKTESRKVEVVYSVTDTGIGIKKESIPHLFSAFKRVDESKNRYIEGTGLGLSIVKQLVELMGGSVAVNSVYTKGTTFVITIPQEVVGEAKIGEIDFETRHLMNERKHYKQSFEAPNAQILVVDDNETNLLVVKKLLRETKVKIDTAVSGAECLKKTLQNRYDVILMDHLMPMMDGVACFHAISVQRGGMNQETAVVALTANAGGENQALYRREGFAGYLLKPVSGAQLEAELLRHLPKEKVKLIHAQGLPGKLESPTLEHKTKRTILISTDSVCDLPQSLLDKYQIAVLPYKVITEGGEFLDGLETETDELLAYIGERGGWVHSEAPDVESYGTFFADQLTKAQYIIHIAMAKNVSSGYENALEASRMFDNVLVVDCGHLSSGMGLMVLKAADYAAEGLAPEKIVSRLEEMQDRVRTSFVVDSTVYLERTGRISQRINKLCNALMLHPVLVLQKSSMKVGTIMIGTRKAMHRRYVKMILNQERKIDQTVLFITYAGLTDKELKEIEAQVKSRVDFEQIYYQKASPAISTNCGPGSFGLLFMLK